MEFSEIKDRLKGLEYEGKWEDTENGLMQVYNSSGTFKSTVSVFIRTPVAIWMSMERSNKPGVSVTFRYEDSEEFFKRYSQNFQDLRDLMELLPRRD